MKTRLTTGLVILSGVAMFKTAITVLAALALGHGIVNTTEEDGGEEMAWNVTGQKLCMVEGDYGIALPVEISGVTLGEQDSIKLTFKASANGDEIFSKEFTGIVDNTVELELTEEESELLPVGTYVYRLDWYQNGNFMCNIIPSAGLTVVDKA